MASATQRSIRAVFGQQQQSKRTPITQKDDKYMQHGQLLLAVQQSPVALERLLAVAKLAVSFLTDLLRFSNDTQDIPILILGHHYVSHRQLGEGTPAAMPGTAAAVAAPAAGPVASPRARPAAGAAAASGAGAGTSYAAYLQEICTFDSNEGPKSFTGVEGVVLALLDLCLEPMAVAKSKRLGREVSIKLGLTPSSGGSRLQLLAWGEEEEEEYSLSWPALHLLAPTSPRCPVVFKGELAISCRATGLLMSLAFAKDCSVKGTIEQLPGRTAAATAAAAAAAAAGGDGGAGSKVQLLGTVAGHWTSVISVSCPGLGLEGVLYDNATVSPAPLPQLDLAHLGPMKLPRVWSAIHDALLYADPAVAAGGRAAAKLATTMSQYLKALTLDSATSRDTAPSAMAAAQPPGSMAGTGLTSSAGAASSAVATADTDADLEEFDRMAEGRGKDTQDSRAVPPSYKAQHAEGNKLKYVLHYSLTSSPSSTAAA